VFPTIATAHRHYFRKQPHSFFFTLETAECKAQTEFSPFNL